MRGKQTFPLAASSCRKMSWKRSLLGVLLRAIAGIHGMGTALGLTTFYYCRRRKSFVDSPKLNRYCRFMGLAFFTIYPIAIVLLLHEGQKREGGITDFARSIVFLGNWLLSALIYANQTSYSTASCDVYNRAQALFVDIMENQYQSFYRDDVQLQLSLAAQCVLKTGLLATGFFVVNLSKFYYLIESGLTLFEHLLASVLFVPSIVMVLASNRFYVATTFTLYLIMKTDESLRAVSEGYRGLIAMRRISVHARNLFRMAADTIDRLSRHRSALHQVFVDFHDMYGKYIVVILGHSFVNVVFEVGLASATPIAQPLTSSFLAALLSLLERFAIDFQWHSVESFLCDDRRGANRFVPVRNLRHHLHLQSAEARVGRVWDGTARCTGR